LVSWSARTVHGDFERRANLAHPFVAQSAEAFNFASDKTQSFKVQIQL